jgi:murein DD-endopeptidase MepM/ murein hydrolase activator NlpD
VWHGLFLKVALKPLWVGLFWQPSSLVVFILVSKRKMNKMAEIIKRNWRQPVDKVKITCVFGLKDTYHPNGHRGTDYAGLPEGAPVKAVADNMVVVLNKWSDVLGNVLVLQVGSRFFGYCHLHEAPSLKVGDKVNAGDVVGKLGNTGSASHGAHLHFTLGSKADSVFAGTVEDAHAFLEAKIAGEK